MTTASTLNFYQCLLFKLINVGVNNQTPAIQNACNAIKNKNIHLQHSHHYLLLIATTNCIELPTAFIASSL